MVINLGEFRDWQLTSREGSVKSDLMEWAKTPNGRAEHKRILGESDGKIKRGGGEDFCGVSEGYSPYI